MDGPQYVRVKTVLLPGEPLAKFDIGWCDERSRSYYLADRSNARVAVINADSLEYAGSLGAGLFTGAASTGAGSGPNGVVALSDDQKVWAGDGDSTIKVFDIASREMVDTVNTGGDKRVDELAYDDADQLVLVANDRETIPFLTVISSSSSHEIVAKIPLPQATNGLQQPVWDSRTRRFYVSVPELDGNKGVGEIAVIDPTTFKVAGSYRIRECQPAGLAVGPDRQLCVGCSQAALAAGFTPRSLIMDIDNGDILATLTEVGGSDEVWYNVGDGNYYFAAWAMSGGPVLGVVNANTLHWVENVLTGADSHSVAVDSQTNRIFVPVTPSRNSPKGGVAVFEHVRIESL